jgi:hypothetical protein
MGKANRETELVLAEAVPPVEPAPVYVPEITVRVFATGGLHDPIMRAFVSCEERVNGTRKLPEAEWDSLYQAFKAAGR